MTRRVSLVLCVPLLVMCLSGCIVVPNGKRAPVQSSSRTGVYSVQTDPYHGRGKGPPAHAPAHGRLRYFKYIYYPGSQIYYSPQRKRYFWYRDRQWRWRTALPKAVAIDRGQGVVVKSKHSTPYRDHPNVARKHPGRGVGHGPPQHRPSPDQPQQQRHSPGFPDEPDQPEPQDRHESPEPAPVDPGPSDTPSSHHDDDDDESNGSGHGKSHSKGKGKGHEKHDDDDDDKGKHDDDD